MDPTFDPTWIIVIVAALAVILAAVYFTRKRRSDQLRSQFGPEYDRTLEETGDRGKAESRLLEREKRVEALSIRPLSPEERDRFTALWRQVQTEFVDDPGQAIGRSDALIGDVMSTRGYPVRDFDQVSEDLSVDHPHVVANYRAAHAIAVRHERGETDTEDLRKGMIHYRELFDELVGEPPAETRSQEREEAIHDR